MKKSKVISTLVHDSEEVTVMVVLRSPVGPGDEEEDDEEEEEEEKKEGLEAFDRRPLLGDAKNPIFRHVSMQEIMETLNER